ncbi:MAG: response regulator [Acetobacteraceae bacterium]
MEAIRKRVLVVEDQDLVGDTIASVLEDEYEVLRSGDADHALRLLESVTVHLVLLDCLLPGGGYPRVVDRCDALQTPVVLMSGDLERAEELRQGRRAFLAKPFAIDVLLETIQRVARE